VSLILRTPIFMMCGINDQKVAIVIFPSLPIGVESTVQFVGEAFRLSPFGARGNSKPISIATTLRQRPDSYPDLGSPNRERSCPQSTARFNILMERKVARCAQPSGGGVCAVLIAVGKSGITGASHDGWVRRLSSNQIRLRSRLRLSEEQIFPISTSA